MYKFIKDYEYYNTSKDNDVDIAYYIYNRLMENGNEVTSSPVNLGIRITNKCRFNCKDCFVNKGSEEMNYDNFLKIFQKLPQKPYYVYLTGGDPFLNKDIFKMIDYLFRKNIKINIHTTGVIDKKIYEQLLFNIKKINNLQISIDSISNFNKIRFNKFVFDPIKEIEKFVKIFKKHIDLKVNFVLRDENKDDIYEVVDFCEYHGINILSISPLIDKKNTFFDKLNMEYYYEIIKYISGKSVRLTSEPFCHPMSLNYKFLKNEDDVERFYCPAGKTECEIDVNGDVYLCPFLYFKALKSGNILHDDFSKIWNSNNVLGRLTWSKRKKCINCKIYEKCGGGCYAYAYVNDKNYDERCNI